MEMKVKSIFVCSPAPHQSSIFRGGDRPFCANITASILSFTARRSLPQVIMSDNATTYTSAAEELTELLSSEEIRTVLGRKGIEWKFISKKAPWFGGYWERLIGLTQASIKKTLRRAHITLPTLQTIATEVEAVLNDRPLTYISDDITDPELLTPTHLLHHQTTTEASHPGGIAGPRLH